MNIITWNINGIRSSKIPLKTLFDELNADVICFQETKVTREQLDEPSAIVDGYTSYFSFSKSKSGYSGVATFVKDRATPFRAEEGLSGLLCNEDDVIGSYGDQSGFTDEELHALDNEGRAVLTQHKLRSSSEQEECVTIINVYCPRADPENAERKSFKLQFYKLLQIRAEALLKQGHVVILGDINTSHKKIDHCDPSDEKEFESNPGRQWLHTLLKDLEKMPLENCPGISSDEELTESPGGKFVDTFRVFHPDEQAAYTCWSTVTGARATNYGVRIDYIFANANLCQRAFKDCVVMQEVEGSDHCPVKAVIDWKPVSSEKCPRLCSKWLPEFAGKQKKLSEFFVKVAKPMSTNSSADSPIAQTVTEYKHPPVKRGSSSELKATTKRAKLNIDKKSLGRKQCSLDSFWGKCHEEDEKNVSDKNTPVSERDILKRNFADKVYATCSQSLSNAINIAAEKEVCLEKKSSASSWKKLLKGPPSAPFCKGHNEPCVLRTVKKDTLNKGRQFWVCPRPEGHKTNPQARCEHFEWISKNK